MTDYAAQNWRHHARANSALEQLIVDFLYKKVNAFSFGQPMMAPECHSGYSPNVPRQITRVHDVAYFGPREAMMVSLKNGKYLGSSDSYGRMPRSWAAEYGHDAVAKLLLERLKLGVWVSQTTRIIIRA